MDYKKSIIGGSIAFVLATSCCWLPALIIAIGGGAALIGVSEGLENFSGVFLVIGIGLLAYGIYAYKINQDKSTKNNVILLSSICCPKCGHKKEETMPTDACLYFYECEKCKEELRPRPEDCCVFCSFGTVACPPIQLNQNCC